MAASYEETVTFMWHVFTVLKDNGVDDFHSVVIDDLIPGFLEAYPDTQEEDWRSVYPAFFADLLSE